MQSTTQPEIDGSSTTPGPMCAVVQTRYGTEPAAVLRIATVERPAAEAGRVVVAVAAASVDMGTWHCMTGLPYAMRLAGFGVRAPKATNPARAFAGTVLAVGEGVTGFEPGDPVYGTCDGAFAEEVSVGVDRLALAPTTVPLDHAASVPISGVTALQAVRKAGVQPGQRVLVLGAAGGVGAYAVQIAKAAGAEVTGVCSTGKVELVASLGADHVVDYCESDVTAGGQTYDVVIDTGGNRRLSDLRRILAPHGTLVIVGSETGGRWLGGFERALGAALLSPFIGPRLAMLASTENSADLDALCELIDAGSVAPTVDRAYPLAEVAAAMQRMRDGRSAGKVLVTLA